MVLSSFIFKVIVIDANQDISILARTYSILAKLVWKSIPKELRTEVQI